MGYSLHRFFIGGTFTLSPLTKASFTCGGGSMIILVSILIRLPFVIQILLLLGGLATSAYGVWLLVKMITDSTKKVSQTPIEQAPGSTPIKKKRPTSTF